jgi:hypothetical protein
VDLVTVLRDPVQRLISQVFFFSGPLTEHHLFSTGQHSVADAKRTADMKVLWQRILSRPRSISADDMRRFLLFLQYKEKWDAFFPRLSLQSYDAVLSRQGGSSPLIPNAKSLAAACAALDGFAAVGTMEHMPSFFVLLSVEFDHPIVDSCFLNNRHTDKKQLYRKPQSDEWQPGVLSVIKEFVAQDSLIWQHALRVHERQLQAHNLTIESATTLWTKTCNSLERHKALNPQLWINGVRQPKSPPTLEANAVNKGHQHSFRRGVDNKNKLAQKNHERLTNSEEDNKDDSRRTVKYIVICLSFTMLFFYILSKA